MSLNLCAQDPNLRELVAHTSSNIIYKANITSMYYISVIQYYYLMLNDTLMMNEAMKQCRLTNLCGHHHIAPVPISI